MGPCLVALGALVVLMVLWRQIRVGEGFVFLGGTVLGFAAFAGRLVLAAVGAVR